MAAAVDVVMFLASSLALGATPNVDAAMLEVPFLPEAEAPLAVEGAGMADAPAVVAFSHSWFAALDAASLDIGAPAYSPENVIANLLRLLPTPARLGLGSNRNAHLSGMDPTAAEELLAYLMVVWVACGNLREFFRNDFDDTKVAMVADAASKSTLAMQLLAKDAFVTDVVSVVYARLEADEGKLTTDLVCTTSKPLPVNLHSEAINRGIEMHAPRYDQQLPADHPRQNHCAHRKGSIFTRDPSIQMSSEFYAHFNLTADGKHVLIPNDNSVR